MDYTIEWGGYPQDVLLRTTGEASVEDSTAMIDAVLADERFRPGLKVLVDHSGLVEDHVTEDDVRAVAAVVVMRRERLEGVVVAVVSPSERHYGFTRRWRTYAQEQLPMIIGVFYSREAATEWLGRAGEQSDPS